MNERVAAITAERIAAEARAAERAARLDPDERYFASDHRVATYNHLYGRIDSVVECESHWDACLVLLARGKSS